LGLGLSVGVIVWLDLRLIGVTLRRQPASQVVCQLEPRAIRGFTVMLLRGSLLFLAEPLKCFADCGVSVQGGDADFNRFERLVLSRQRISARLRSGTTLRYALAGENGQVGINRLMVWYHYRRPVDRIFLMA
jgi:hypothetical protein